MGGQKQIIVLSGGGHKGVVRLTESENITRGSCSLDFRPSGAQLFLIGKNVAKVALYDINQTFEVPFSAESGIGCVMRSSSVTMFGGEGAHSEMLRKIEEAKAAFAEAPKEEVPSASTETPLREAREETCDPRPESSETAEGDAAEKAGETLGFSKMKAASSSAVGDQTRYDGNNFYYAVKPQLDEMFICYPEEKTLCASVPNSKWVRIDAKDGFYVVGVLYDGEEPAFICYGVPEYTQNRRPPQEIEDMCVWLPLGGEFLGFWMIYQSAKTGEIIK